MSSKIFKETDSWGDSSGPSNSVDFSFKKTPKNKSKKEKRAKKRKIAEINNNGEVGRFVRPPNWNIESKASEDEVTPEKVNKKKDRKRKHEKVEPLNSQSSDGITPEKKFKKHIEIPKPTRDEQPKSFGDKLRDSLKGSRFRFLNEQMYKQTGRKSLEIFKEDPSAFDAYHEGYRHQIANWPMNPLDRMINNIKRLPKDHIIVDMGCGEARLSKSVTQKVYSIDLVSNEEGVIVSDMAKTPLENKCAHVVVYCLSLMGTNLKDFLIEANRILKMNGLLKVAEVASRFDDVKVFIEFVQLCGFELVSKDLSHNLFYFLNFKKTHDVNAFNKKINDFSLKPCLYKKR